MPNVTRIDRPAAAHLAGVARASAIVRGLLRTGRARPRRLADTGDQTAEFIRLERRAAGGQFYWIARDGSEILAGRGLVDAEPLQAGFVERMANSGADSSLNS
jgi:hypothetical protein